MRLVRSDEEPTTGALVEIATLDVLARRWYGNRLDRDWRPRTQAEAQAILTSVGLTDDFWRL
jgi:hypothetical protein